MEGLDAYLLYIKHQGVFDVANRLGWGLKRALNRNGQFSGRIFNKKNIGKTTDPLTGSLLCGLASTRRSYRLTAL